MKNEDHVFDYMAAAEETGRQLDALTRQIPGLIKTAMAAALADEWRKVTVFNELANATGKLNDAINEVRETVKLLRQTIWAATILGIFLAIIVPSIIWMVTSK